MKTAAILGFSSLLVGLVAAAPLEKRAYVTHTVTEEVVETVDVTVTVTVEAVTITPAAAAQAAETTEADYSWSWDHGHHQAEAQETQAPAATTTHQEEAYVAPTEAPAATTTTAAAPVQEEPKVEEQQHQEQHQEQPQEQYQEPAKEEVKEAQVQENYVQPQQSAGGESHTGEITFYDVGLGACGWTNDGSSEYVVALSHLLMGEQSNGNPYCGKTIEVERDGKTVQAKVVDKCMGCAYGDVDLSRKAFGELAHEDEGRVPGCSWKFVN